MVASTWLDTRDSLRRLFGRSGKEAQDRQTEMLDEDRELLTAAAPDQRAEIEQELSQRWTIQLAALLQQHPEVADDLLDVLAQSDELPKSGSQGTFLNAIGNQSSQIVQAGGDLNTGGGDITYRTKGK
ncbi:hypothetical protein ACFY4C_36575 [Actinomadura viridis]|uniref:hypothetical protein n=1 Tax=Actinomadura viridis TaxID=58110 RepID=UPI0036C27ABE